MSLKIKLKWFSSAIVMLLLLSFNIGNNIAYSQEIREGIPSMNSIEDEMFFELFFLESEYNDGEYLISLEKLIDIDNYNDYLIGKGFEEYDGGYLPIKKDVDKHSYTFIGLFFVDEALRKEDLAVYIPPIDYAAKFYINNQLLKKSGQYSEEVPTIASYITSHFAIPKKNLNYEGVNVFAVQIYPDYLENTPLGEHFISSFKKVTTQAFWRTFFNKTLVRAAFVISFILALFMLLNFFVRRLNDFRYLYFAIFCFFI